VDQGGGGRQKGGSKDRYPLKERKENGEKRAADPFGKKGPKQTNQGGEEGKEVVK